MALTMCGAEGQASARGWIRAAMAATLWMASSALLPAQSGGSRTWTSADGKHQVEAEYVSATERKVTLLKADGRKVTVPLEQLTKSDQQYVARMRSGDVRTPSTDDASTDDASTDDASTDDASTDDASTDDAQAAIEGEIRGKVSRFYLLLRKTDRGDLQDLLVAAARATLESNAPFFDTVTPPDRGSSPRVREVVIDGDKAVATVRLKVAGRFRDVDLTLRQESGKWLIRGLSAEDDGGQVKTLDFVAGQMVDGDSSQLDAPEQLVNAGLGGPGSELVPGVQDRLPAGLASDAGLSQDAGLRAGPPGAPSPAGVPPFALPPDMLAGGYDRERPLPAGEAPVGIERPIPRELPRELQDAPVDK